MFLVSCKAYKVSEYYVNIANNVFDYYTIINHFYWITYCITVPPYRCDVRTRTGCVSTRLPRAVSSLNTQSGVAPLSRCWRRPSLIGCNVNLYLFICWFVLTRGDKM